MMIYLNIFRVNWKMVVNEELVDQTSLREKISSLTFIKKIEITNYSNFFFLINIHQKN
jgi:uncharacterized protein YlbG (UPF0298 family)